MIALQIKNTKNFMNMLLVNSGFDDFEVEEAAVTTFNAFHIDGRIVREFFSDDEIKELSESDGLSEFSKWRDIRPVCFQLIKGKKTPVAFRVTLRASRKLVEKLAGDDECEVAANLIRSFVINVRYENARVSCVTGIAFDTFIMDKSAERIWDAYVRKLFTDMGIDFEE